jgi:uncharacterized protein YciI
LTRSPTYHVIVHMPGPAWRPGVPFFEQPNVEGHVAFMRSLDDRGLMALGGPFVDEESGGMAVVETATAEEADALAREDPSIANGLLTFRIRPWRAVMGSLAARPAPAASPSAPDRAQSDD